jgi:hypothetical protein
MTWPGDPPRIYRFPRKSDRSDGWCTWEPPSRPVRGSLRVTGPRDRLPVGMDGILGVQSWNTSTMIAKFLVRKVEIMANTVDPRAVDMQLAALWTSRRDLEEKLRHVIDDAHYCIGETPTHVYGAGRNCWRRTTEEAVAMCRELAAVAPERQPLDRWYAPATVADYDRLTMALVRVAGEAERLDAVCEVQRTRLAGCPGRIPVKGSTRSINRRVYGVCPECGVRKLVNKTGMLRRHRPLGVAAKVKGMR